MVIVKGILFQLLVALVCGFTFAEEPMRTWTSTDGRKLEAKFIGQVGIDGVEVETSTGAKVTLYKSRISLADWNYVKKVSTKEVTDSELFTLPKALNGRGAFIVVSVNGDVEVFENRSQEGVFGETESKGKYVDGKYIESGIEEKKRASGKKASVGQILNIGSIVITSGDSEVMILITNGSLISIGENSRVVLDNLWQTQFTLTNQKINQLTTEPSQSRTSLELDYGDMTVQVKKLNKGSSFSVRSQVGVAGIRGTKFRLSSRDGKAELSVTEGVVDYRDDQNKTFSVKQDKTLTAQKNMNTSQKDLDDEEKKKIKVSLAKASEDLAKYDLNKLGVEVQKVSQNKKNLIIPLTEPSNEKKKRNSTLNRRYDSFLEMIWCPPGSFQDSRKQIQIIKKGFYLAKYELTTSNYLCVIKGEDSDKVRINNMPVANPPYNSQSRSYSYSNFLNLLTIRARNNEDIPQDWNFTYPSHKEWEYACRAGTTGKHWWGNDINRRWQKRDHVRGIRISSKYANYTVLGLEPTREPKEVGLYLPNPWGFHDMWGNVSEVVSVNNSEYTTIGGSAKSTSFSFFYYSPSNRQRGCLRVALKKIE